MVLSSLKSLVMLTGVRVVVVTFDKEVAVYSRRTSVLEYTVKCPRNSDGTPIIATYSAVSDCGHYVGILTATSAFVSSFLQSGENNGNVYGCNIDTTVCKWHEIPMNNAGITIESNSNVKLTFVRQPVRDDGGVHDDVRSMEQYAI